MIRRGMAVRAIKFVEELPQEMPSSYSRQTDWARTLQVLRINPMKWALVREFDSSSSAHTCLKIIKKHLSHFEDSAKFNLSMRRPEIGKWSIYGQYINEEKVIENEL